MNRMKGQARLAIAKGAQDPASWKLRDGLLPDSLVQSNEEVATAEVRDAFRATKTPSNIADFAKRRCPTAISLCIRAACSREDDRDRWHATTFTRTGLHESLS
jgi:hypothetical protein